MNPNQKKTGVPINVIANAKKPIQRVIATPVVTFPKQLNSQYAWNQFQAGKKSGANNSSFA